MKHLLLFGSVLFCLSACSGVDSLGELSENTSNTTSSKMQLTSTEHENRVKAPTKPLHSQPSLNRVNQVNNEQMFVLDSYLTSRLTATMRDAGNSIAGQRSPIYYHPQTGQYYYGHSGAANYYFNQSLKK